MNNWPSILWHFFDQENKYNYEEQCAKIIEKVVENKNLKFKVTRPEESFKGITSRCLCLTSLPSNTLERHIKRYGKFAFGFKRDELSGYCTSKNFVLNPVLYCYPGFFSNVISEVIKDQRHQDNLYEIVSGCNQQIPKEVDICIGNIHDSIDALSCLAKVIKPQDPYDFYEEQEWRLVTLKDKPHVKAKGVFGEGFINIPIRSLAYLACPCPYYEQKIKEKINKSVSVITFDKINDVLWNHISKSSGDGVLVRS